MKLLLCLALILVGPVVRAQECVQAVPVNVVDEKTGRAVSVDTAAFHASLGQMPLAIRSIEPIHTRRVLVLVEQSGRVAAASDWTGSYDLSAMRAVFHVLDEWLGELPCDVSVEYGLFDDEALFSESFKSDQRLIRQDIAAVNERFNRIGHFRTIVYDALGQGLNRFQNPGKEDAVLLVSYGTDWSSHRSIKGLEKEFRASGVRLFVTLLKSRTVEPHQLGKQDTLDTITQAPELAQQESLAALAQRTGGSVHVVDAANAVWAFKGPAKAASAEIKKFWNESLLNGYLLQVQVPATLSTEQKWTLSLNRGTDSRLKNAKVTYGDRLLPCAASTASR